MMLDLTIPKLDSLQRPQGPFWNSKFYFCMILDPTSPVLVSAMLAGASLELKFTHLYNFGPQTTKNDKLAD